MTIHNTTSNPELNLLGALLNPDGFIEAQEAQGQSQLVNSTLLPVDTGGNTKEEFEALGFTFGTVDDIFQEATLPEGWTKTGTDHSMWSKIVDERGVERVEIFYKAAFYDRSAFMRISRVGYNLFSNLSYHGGSLPSRLTPEEVLDFIDAGLRSIKDNDDTTASIKRQGREEEMEQYLKENEERSETALALIGLAEGYVYG